MGYLNLKLRGANLESPSALRALSAPNPVYKLSAFQMGQAEPFHVVMSSEILAGNEKPVWKAASISLDELCSNDKDFPIMISVFDYAEQELLIGTCETTVSDLIRNRVGNADDVDVAKVFSLKDGSRHGNKTGIIVVVEAFLTEEPLVGDGNMGTFSRGDHHRLDQNDTNAELKSLRKALDAVLIRTEKLEEETSDLRHENRHLNKKVTLLEETLMQTRTKMKTAIKDMNLMNDERSFRSDNNKSLRLTDNVLDESLCDSSYSEEMESKMDDDTASRKKTDRSDRSLNKDGSRSGTRDQTQKPTKIENHTNDHDARSYHIKESHRPNGDSNQKDSRSVHNHQTKDKSYHHRDGRSTHRHHTKEESLHAHFDQPISRDTSPDLGASRSVSPRAEGANRARRERSKHRDRTESPKRYSVVSSGTKSSKTESRSTHRERSKTPDHD